MSGAELGALLHGDRVGPDLPGAHQRQEAARRRAHEIELARQQILHRGRAAAVRYELPAHAERLLHDDAAHVLDGAVADRSLRDLGGIGLDPCDEVLEGRCRHAVRADDQEWIGRQLHHRREVGDHVVGQRQRDRVEHVRLRAADRDRVAVRRRARYAADADAPAGAADILDHDVLPEGGLHAVGEQPRQRVRDAAGRIRHDKRDRPCREHLLAARDRRGQQDECDRQKPPHRSPLAAAADVVPMANSTDLHAGLSPRPSVRQNTRLVPRT